MELFLRWLLENSLKAGIMAGLIWVVMALVSRRISARARYLLWGLVAIRLLMPGMFPASFSIYNLWHRGTSAALTPSVAAPFPRPVAEVRTKSEISPATDLADRVIHRFPLWTVVFAVWLSGVALLSGLLLLRYYRFTRRIVAQRPLTDQRWLDLLEDCKAQMGLHVPVSVVESSLVTGPALFGFIRPRLLLPMKAATLLSVDDMRYVFLHELAHLRRNDIAVNWLLTAIQLMHWFNPVVWYALMRMRAEREQAGDETVLIRLDATARLAYGRTIIRLLELSPQFNPLAGMAGIMENRQQMQERIKMIRNFRIMPFRHALLAVILMVGLGVFCFSEEKSNGKAAGSATSFGVNANFWMKFQTWQMMYKNSTTREQAAKMLPDMINGVYRVKFRPVNGFNPVTPMEFLDNFSRHSSLRSGKDRLGGASFFRTTEAEGKLVGSFLTEEPDRMKTDIAKNPSLQLVSCEAVTPETFVQYLALPQESLKIKPAAFAESVAVATATARAEAWLVLVDEGKYPESWQDAATLFRTAVSREQWATAAGAVRKSYGKPISRKVKSAVFCTSLPGAPDGQYVVIQFETSFEHKKNAIETVTPMMDKDGKFHVSGYYIK